MEDTSLFVSITPSQSSGYDSSEAAQGKHKCPVCNYNSDYRTSFLKHMEMHEKNSEFRCRICSYSSNNECNIMQHQMEDHSPAAVPHLTLLRPEQRRESWRKTRRATEGDPVEVSVLHCPECFYWNRFTSAFHEHLMTHLSDSTFRCSECAYKSNQRNRITKHIRELREAGQHSSAEVLLIHPIPEDEYASYRRMTLVQSDVVSGWRNVEEGNDTGIEMEDSTSSTELAPVKLEEISISGAPSQTFFSHSGVVQDSECEDIQMDSGVNEPGESTPGDETQEINEGIGEEEIVSRQFPTPPSGTFKRPGKTHECNICQFTSTEASKFRMHMVMHTRSSGYRCTICNYSSSKRRLTELHIRRDHHLPVNHPGTSTEAECNASQLREDTSNATTIQNNVFCCPDCSYWNKSISTFHDHLLSHQSSSPFKCSICKFSSKHRTRINQHIREKKKDGKASHSSARTELTHPIPDSGYAEFRLWIPIPKGARYGWKRDIHIPRGDTMSNLNDGLPSPQNDVIIFEDDTLPPTIEFQHVVEIKSEPLPTDDINIIYEDNKNDKFYFASQLPSFQDLLISYRAIGLGRKKVRLSIEASMKNEKVKKFMVEDEETSLKVIQIIDSIRSASSTLNETKEVPILTLSDTWLQEKVHSVRSKVKAMTERLKKIEKELSEIKMTKEGALKKLKDAIKEKIKTEFSLRTFQCKILSLSISEFDALSSFKVNDPSVLAEEKHLKEKVAQTRLNVKAIQEKNKKLTTMLQDVEKSRDEFAKVLKVLQSELQLLEQEINELLKDCSQNRLNEMISNIQEQIETFKALEERRFKIKFLRARAQVRQKQKHCVEMLKKAFVDEEASALFCNNCPSPRQSLIEIFPD